MNNQAKLALVSVVVLAAALATVLVFAGPAQCRDGIDNDGDGNTDYPADTGCSSRSDNDETNCGDNVCSAGESASTCGIDCQICGNSVIEGNETCDGSALNNQTCASQGYTGGTLACNSNCNGFVTTSCYTNSCSSTDGNFDVYTAGTTSGSTNGVPFSFADTCIDADLLTEYGCSGSTVTAFNFSCSMNATGCSAGACI